MTVRQTDTDRQTSKQAKTDANRVMLIHANRHTKSFKYEKPNEKKELTTHVNRDASFELREYVCPRKKADGMDRQTDRQTDKQIEEREHKQIESEKDTRQTTSYKSKINIH